MSFLVFDYASLDPERVLGTRTPEGQDKLQRGSRKIWIPPDQVRGKLQAPLFGRLLKAVPIFSPSPPSPPLKGGEIGYEKEESKI